MDSLCDDILLQVFHHIKDYEPLRFTCKRFNQLICELHKNKAPLSIKNATLHDAEVYSSIRNSKRIFDRMILNSNQIETLESYWRLKTVSFQMGRTITTLTWKFAKMTKTEIVAILNQFPNLQTIKCDSWRLKTEFHDEPKEILKLPCLRSLSISGCCELTTDFFNEHLRLHSLTKLAVDVYDASFISNQGSLLDFSITEQELPNEWIPVPLTHLSLNLRKYRNNDCSILNTILLQQPELEHLNIINCGGIFDEDDDAFISMCSLKNLKTLKINIDDLNHIVFKEHFYKLEKLEELFIESCEHNYTSLVDIVEQLSKIKMEFLTSLNIDLEDVGIPLDRIENMGRNYPLLRKFELKCDLPLPLDIYLRNFKMLNELSMNFHYSQEFSYVCSNLDDLCFPNISHLELEGFNFGSDINLNEAAFLKLLNALPYLEELDIDINLPLNSRLFLSIPEKLPKLTKIRSLTFSQNNDNYERFNLDCVNNFILISEKLERISVELKLKAIDMDVTTMKQMLGEKYRVSMKKSGAFVIIGLFKFK